MVLKSGHARRGAGRQKGIKKEWRTGKKTVYNKSPIVLTTKKEIEKMSALANKCVVVGLNYAYSVLNNNEQVEITRLNKYHQSEVVKQDRYTPEQKIKLFEILVDKVFSNRKDPAELFENEDGIKVVGFNYVKIGKGKK